MKTLNDKQLDAMLSGLPSGDYQVLAVWNTKLYSFVSSSADGSEVLTDLALHEYYDCDPDVLRSHPAIEASVECRSVQNNARWLYVVTIAYQKRGLRRGGCWVHYMSRRVLRHPSASTGYCASDSAVRRPGQPGSR